MSDENTKLKSAYELALERLQAEDRKEGRSHRALSEDQKTRIREMREEARAKLAELEILHRKNLAGAAPDAVAEIEQHYQIDRERVESRMESEIRKIKEKG